MNLVSKVVFLACLAAAYAAPALELISPASSTEDGNGLKIDFEIVQKSAPLPSIYSSHNLSSKISVEMPLSNQQYYYRAQLFIGSNKQPVYVTVDTGSSELWVVGVNSACTSTDGSSCVQSGTYNPASSQTSSNLTEPFKIGYGDGTESQGVYFKDDITFGDVILHQAEFGVTTETSGTQGVLGIGFDTLMGRNYPNFPDLLVNEGLIQKNYYSLYLNGPESSSGSILYGGVDSTMYTGPLLTVPITSKTRLTINLVSVSSQDGSTTPGGFDVLLDTGSTLSSLPQSVADYIASKYENASYLRGRSCYQIGCNIPQGNLTYNFDQGASIQVPYSALLWYQSGNTCYLGLSYQMGGFPAVLGDNFLRSAYIVFDLTDETISLAQSVFS